ncbi:MAG: hypothetical protein K8R54_06755 [Bacteroidales bacterium]|nr:hypothetical protein [Bacteroidales bacterium]
MKRNKKYSNQKRYKNKDNNKKNMPGIIRLKKYIAVLVIFVLVTLMFGIPEKNNAQIINDALINSKKSLSELIKKEEPKIIFLGNSIIRDGLSDSVFTSLANLNVIKHNPGGSGTAEWYLYLKNVFFSIDNTSVDLIVITFRDRQITDPKVGTTGGAKFTIDRFSTVNEPLYERLVLNNNMDIISYMFYKNLEILQRRHIIKKDFETNYKNLINYFLYNFNDNVSDSIIDMYFSTENMNINELTKIELIEKQEKNNFEYLLNKSFLPHIIKLIKQNNKEVIFVRYKKRRDLQADAQPIEIKEYMQTLKMYLQDNNVKLIDITYDTRIKEEHYRNGDHFNKKGEKLFTEILFEQLKKNCSSFTNKSVKLSK